VLTGRRGAGTSLTGGATVALVPDFLELLYAGASEESFDELVASAERDGISGQELDELRRRRAVALRLRERMQRLEGREAELTALYETANDLTAIRDVDAILAAIVRRARQLLNADMTYLSLNDEAEGASFMKTTEGSISAEFRNLRLPLGTGLLGLVAQTGAPYHTDDYQNDARFKHEEYIDHAVADEGIRAILGVPLLVEGTVIGALLAVHRTVRAFPSSEVSLLTSFAAHAAVALENARLFEATRQAMARLDDANRRISEQSKAVQAAAAAHDRLTDVLLRGGDLEEVATVLGEVLEGTAAVYDEAGHPVTRTGSQLDAGLASAVEEARTSGRAVEAGGATWVATALAGAEHLGTVVLRGRTAPMELSHRRTLERGAMVTALVLLFSRSVADAEDRVRGELLSDLLSGREQDRVRLRERARLHHADLDRLDTVLVADVAAEDRVRAQQAVSRFAAERGGLGGGHDRLLVAVLPAGGSTRVALGQALADRLAALLGRQRAATVGVAAVGTASLGIAAGGTAAADPGAFGDGWQEARTCLVTLRTLGRAGDVSDAAGLGLARLVLGHNGPEELAGFVALTLGPLLEHDARRNTDLLHTLDTWYAAGGALAETARRLHVHPNTVAQRLDRIGRLLGDGWRSPERALEQQLALRLHRMRGV
jgi:GAF domain-containing protein/sugar diacid utilization regulator